MRSIMFVFILVFSFSVPTQAWYYKMYQKRLVPISQNEPKRLLSKEKLGDATYYNQERIDKLRSELNTLNVQLKKQNQNQKRLEDALLRFRNYYFRNI